jgi:putative phosphonate metabolism protein
MSTGVRYAIYYAPGPSSALWRFGCSIIGRDAVTGEAVVQPALRGIAAERLAELTAEPRQYGFHATLKAPFRLMARWDVRQLEDALQDFVARATPPTIDGLALTEIGSFLALTPVGDTRALANFAQSIVEAFEPFRAELTDADRKRRLASGLSDRQIGYLDKFGYPYVADEFRFHMTLTGRLPAGERATLMSDIGDFYASQVAIGPLVIGRLALFEQSQPGAPFRIRATFERPTVAR